MKSKKCFLLILLTGLIIATFTGCSVTISQDRGIQKQVSASFQTKSAPNINVNRLTGVNWFGFETGNACPHGLWTRDYKSMLKQIKDLGFNCIRLPWCNDMLTAIPNSIQINASGVDAYTGIKGLNLDLAGLNAIQVMDKVLEECARLDIKIILDNHSRAHDGYMNETLWYKAGYTEEKWISDWVMLVNRYINNPVVIGADLKNEPHGNMTTGMKPPATWGYNEPGQGVTDWKAAAERCGQAILAANPNMLIIIEGVESFKGSGYWWGGNLKGVKEYPVTSIPKANLVYSAHEYGSGVFNQSWFSAPNYPENMPAIWDDNFWFIYKQNIAPVLIGEFGIQEAQAANPNSIDYKWLTTFMAYVGKQASWTFWCINPDSGDTGGILKDDWVTVNTAKYNILKPYLAGFDSASSSSISTSSSRSSAITSSRSSVASTSSASSSVSSSGTSSSAGQYVDKTAPLSFDGTGEFYWSMTSIPNFINSWNLTALEINGVSFLNKWAAASALPAKQNGYYYIHYKGPYAWSHFEAK